MKDSTVEMNIQKAKSEEGYILLWVLFYFVLFYLLALSFLDISVIEFMISINHHRDVQATAIANGGVLIGNEQIYKLLNRDYSNTQQAPEQITLDKQEWLFTDEAGNSFLLNLSNPIFISQTEEECCYQFMSTGNCEPAQKKITVQVRIKYQDCYTIHNQEDGTSVMMFDHRDFLSPVRIYSLKITS